MNAWKQLLGWGMKRPEGQVASDDVQAALSPQARSQNIDQVGEHAIVGLPGPEAAESVRHWLKNGAVAAMGPGLELQILDK